jgi:hypothetical protein
MKTLDDFMKNDVEIKWMPEYLREIHCARRVIMEETADMNEEETTRFHNEAAADLFDELGIPLPKIVSFAHNQETVLNK